MEIDADVEAARVRSAGGHSAYALASFQGHIERMSSDEERRGIEQPDFTPWRINERPRVSRVSSSERLILWLLILVATLAAIGEAVGG